MLKLPAHGRYLHSSIEKRPLYDWPSGKRLAFYLGLHIEHFAFMAGIGNDPRPIGNPQPIIPVLRNVDGPITIIVGEQVARDDARAELEELRALLRARVATAEERTRLWPLVTADHKNYAGYQSKTTREIPLVLLEPEA